MLFNSISDKHVVDHVGNRSLLPIVWILSFPNFGIVFGRMFSRQDRWFGAWTTDTLLDSFDCESRWSLAHTKHWDFHIFEFGRSTTWAVLFKKWSLELERSFGMTCTRAWSKWDVSLRYTCFMSDFSRYQCNFTRTWFRSSCCSWKKKIKKEIWDNLY